MTSSKRRNINRTGLRARAEAFGRRKVGEAQAKDKLCLDVPESIQGSRVVATALNLVNPKPHKLTV